MGGFLWILFLMGGFFYVGLALIALLLVIAYRIRRRDNRAKLSDAQGPQGEETSVEAAMEGDWPAAPTDVKDHRP